MFKVGDKVRIREWDDMVKEFGTDSCGSIDCMFDFMQSMKYLCGKEFVITDIVINGEVCGFRDWEGCNYAISTDMIEHILI